MKAARLAEVGQMSPPTVQQANAFSWWIVGKLLLVVEANAQFL